MRVCKRKALNEKGFMFPLTLCIILLFTLFISINTNHFLAEKRFSIEIEKFQRNQFYFLQSLMKLEQILKEEGDITSGIFYYDKGTLTYTAIEEESSIRRVDLRLRTVENGQLTGIAYFDVEYGKLTKWVERN